MVGLTLKLKLQYFGHLMRKLTHWKRPWCWEGLGAGGEGDDRGWDGWMASLTQWTWVWVNSGSWWWTGRPSVLRFMGLQRVGHHWATELNWILSMFFWNQYAENELMFYSFPFPHCPADQAETDIFHLRSSLPSSATSSHPQTESL